MSKKSPLLSRRASTLHLAVENEDWIAITGSPDELVKLGQILIDFASADDQNFLILDSPSDYFSTASLGITLYKIGHPTAPLTPSETDPGR